MDAEWRRVFGVRRPLTRPDGSFDRNGAVLSLVTGAGFAIGGVVVAALAWTVDSLSRGQRVGFCAVLLIVSLMSALLAWTSWRRLARESSPSPRPAVDRRRVAGWTSALGVALLVGVLAVALPISDVVTVEVAGVSLMGFCIALGGLLGSPIGAERWPGL